MLDRETKKKKKMQKNVNPRGKEVETEENMMKSLVRYRKLNQEVFPANSGNEQPMRYAKSLEKKKLCVHMTETNTKKEKKIVAEWQ